MPAHVGQELQRARVARGQSIEAVAQAALVSVLDLAALERGDLDAIGSPPRAKAVLRTYARVLDLDAEQLLLDVDALEASAEPQITETAVAVPAAPAVRRRRVPWLVLAALLCAAFAVAVMALVASRGDAPEQEPDPVAGRRPETAAAVAARPSADALLAPSGVTVQIINGSGSAAAAGDASDWLETLGYEIAAIGQARQPYTETTLFYSPGWERAARALADADHRIRSARPNDRGLDEGISLHLVLGENWIAR